MKEEFCLTLNNLEEFCILSVFGIIIYHYVVLIVAIMIISLANIMIIAIFFKSTDLRYVKF